MSEQLSFGLWDDDAPAVSAPAPVAGALHYATAGLPALLALLDDWARRGWLRELDRVFADFLAREAPDAAPLLILAAALASHQLGRGHVCLDLQATLADASFALSLPPEGDAPDDRPVLPGAFLAGLDLARWRAALVHPLLVGDADAVAPGAVAPGAAAPGAAAPGAGALQGVACATPLVRVGARLYLRRYWQYERQVRAAIGYRLTLGVEERAALPLPRLRAALDALFLSGAVVPGAPCPTAASHRPADWQKLACAMAAGQRFSIITGGPGTGKTTTVVTLLALLQSMALHGGGAARALRIRLAAPTGKAAARLNESIAQAVQRLPLDHFADAEALRAAIPTEVTTLHRLLGSRPDTRHFRHDARHPLSLDVLVIDEASMIDLEMMSAVLAALPRHARLVLLGDKDQLASVEAGAVLGELCRHAREGRYLPAQRDWLEAASGETVDPALLSPAGTPLDQAVAMLRESYRFTAHSGIGRLAEAVNAGAVRETRAVWSHGYPDLARISLPVRDTAAPDKTAASSHTAALRALVVDGAPTQFPNAGRDRRMGGTDGTDGTGNGADMRLPPPVGYRHYLDILRKTRPPLTDGEGGVPRTAAERQQAFDDWARNVLAAHGRFQVLCALRRGEHGVDGLNRRIAALLFADQLISSHEGWYLGRPVLVTRNDYGLGLMNGDIGITLALPHQAPGEASPRWILRVAFLTSDGRQGIKWVLPSRLQAVETVYAMTVHKSQGSEFAHAALVLPERLNPILTRELVYTGITRARHWFTLASAGTDHQVFEAAIERQVQRASGLIET
ncbi:exodeoxyribonuclease V subunit alpha [Robbsia sp. Bb-Pol-6]|uniref:RecBCD enzyme subunit RecD n=1 Tax=Robbsia betulipollinis TaxID=2981849 RepID=A0ABT3ZL23_9BURK|nr:exodeoxyribonuclease V subunit alpha [Robbsia betulipollinis]MCY0387112.1 exodeoxyribonuclease V subunit alpha [Robbsia betulipollinis]